MPVDTELRRRRKLVLACMGGRLKHPGEVLSTILTNWGATPEQLCKLLRERELISRSTYWCDVKVLQELSRTAQYPGNTSAIGGDIAALMDAICAGIGESPAEFVIDSSDNDNDSGEIYVDAPTAAKSFVVKITER